MERKSTSFLRSSYGRTQRNNIRCVKLAQNTGDHKLVADFVYGIKYNKYQDTRFKREALVKL